MNSYIGHKVLITGASSGLGRYLAIELSKANNQVVICGRDEERLKETFNQMSGDNHILVVADLNNYEEIPLIFKKALVDGIKLDGMIHCAGIARPTPVRALNLSDIEEMTRVNYLSFLYLVQNYAKKTNNCGGSIVAVSSINSHYPQKYMTVYAATKAALEASVRNLALELNDKNIRINSVVPGALNTPMISNTAEDELERIISKQLNGLIDLAGVKNAVEFLLSDNSAFITGRELYVDGGRFGQ